MSYGGDFIQVRPDVAWLALQTRERCGNGIKGVWNKVLAPGQDAGLITRKHNDVAALHKMIDPRSVIEWICPAPAMQENNYRCGLRLRSIRFVNPIFFAALTISILNHACVWLLFPARPRFGLRRRRRQRLSPGGHSQK